MSVDGLFPDRSVPESMRLSWRRIGSCVRRIHLTRWPAARALTEWIASPVKIRPAQSLPFFITTGAIASPTSPRFAGQGMKNRHA